MNIKCKIPAIQRKKLPAAIGLALAVGCAGGAFAQESAGQNEDRITEIVVTSLFQESEAETAMPVGVLAGDALREHIGNSLGDTLKNEIGVASASFGTGVGLPVIRGQSANRVKVLQNGVGVTDVSNASPDHANAVNVALAERLEVIRGPSTLLYGSSAIGGVVNVIDNRIPESLPEDMGFVVQQMHNTVNSQDETLIHIDGAVGNVAFHLDAYRSRNENVEIGGYAMDEEAMEALEELFHEHFEEGHHDDHDDHGHHDDHDDHDDHDEREGPENTFGYIGNSDGESSGGSFGFSFIGDNGFFGVSASEVEKNYGLPLGVHAHVHDHGEEEHEGEHDEHEDEHDHEEDDHEDEHGHGGEAVEFVRLDMKKSRYDFKSEYRFDNGFIESVRATMGITDYVHDEIEFFEDGDTHVGTRYSNEGNEGRITLTHAPVGNWTGVWGMQFADTVFSAIGEEAFVPQSDLNSIGLFAVERYSAGNWTGEFGIHMEDNRVDPNGRCEFNTNATSLSGMVLYDAGDDANLLFGAARSQRAPAVEELYSNVSELSCAPEEDYENLVFHAGTNTLDIGNPLLEAETSNNLEFGYRRHGGSFTGEFNAYYNQIDDYIFLDLTGEFEEQTLARYLQRDARFTGIEGEVFFNVMEGGDSSLSLGVFGDMVNAEFDTGGYVPRIPASRLGAELRWSGNDWSVNLRATRVNEQEDVAELELPTDGYTLLSLYADYRIDVGEDSSLEVFLRGENLLDEEIRNHVSLLKNYAPEPGRGVIAGVRFEY
ncbi:MAG: TonB-dependent receptor [Gammaproteobacteria bacterium]|nr:TonB-dependent receptor [Gammaproteobacteria bacterium]MYH85258.1 TonB-dependent receptor [Gammaproteobacteria bacterium]MYK05905.1 TonB-dependent receptor [Gammaproteobacteria bacterium]